MRVCMVAYTFYDFDNRVRRYAETLAKRGDCVDVIALRQNHQPSSAVVRGVNVFRIQKRVVDESGKLSYLFKLLLFFFKSMIILTRKHLKSPYHLIHVHSVPDFEVFAAWVPKLTGSKVILDIHDLVPEFYASKFNVNYGCAGYRLLSFIERLSATFSHHVIVSNHIWRKTLLSRSVSAPKCTAILNFPDPSIFYRRGRDRTDNKFIMLYPGTLNHHQGLDIAIRAFAMIKDRVPEAEFHIYGSGEGESLLKRLIRELDLGDRVFLKERVPLTEIPAVMENSDLAIVPKRANSFGNEAFSTKILEFMSVGVPVLVSDTKVDRYYFDESVVKFFPSGDEKYLADCMLLLTMDRELRSRISKNAEQYVRRNNWDIKKGEYLDLVDSVTNNHRRQNVERTAVGSTA